MSHDTSHISKSRVPHFLGLRFFIKSWNLDSGCRGQLADDSSLGVAAGYFAAFFFQQSSDRSVFSSGGFLG